MNESVCGVTRDMIPDLAAGRITEPPSALRVHLEHCDDCRAELALAVALVRGRPAAPPGLNERVLAKLGRAGPVPMRSPWWGLTAAAVAALALGIGIRSDGTPTVAEVPGYAYETEEGVVWGSEDGLLAGAPLFDGLTDEVLEQLLDELTVGSSGGAA